MEWYGLSEANGSWNTIRSCCRYFRRPFPKVGTGWPSRSTVPLVGRSSCVRIFAIVDLPLPDCPTRPSVCPDDSVKLTASRARS
jgi:hypothetical protein